MNFPLFTHIGGIKVIAYNSKVDFLTIKEKDILKEISKREKELHYYGLSNEEIANINNTCNIDLSSYDIEKILLSISICELLWYNRIYREYRKFKGSLRKIFLNDDAARLDTLEEKRHYNTFLSAMTLIVQKYGEELLDEVGGSIR